MIEQLIELIDPIKQYLTEQENYIAPAATHSLLAAVAANETPLLLVTTSTRSADELAMELQQYLGDSVCNFPPWETLPHERLSPKSDTITARFKALDSINKLHKKVVVTSIRALIQPIIENDQSKAKINISVGLDYELSKLVGQLSKFGFNRVDLVERRGDFAVRGGIVDIFPADQEHPIRIDYFADQIEEIAYFSIADQRSISKIENLMIYPCRELIIDDQIKTKALEIGERNPQLKELTEKISQGIYFEGIESMSALLIENYCSLIDYLPASTELWFIDKPRIISRSVDLIETNQEFLEAAWSNLAWSNQASISFPLNLTAEFERGSFYNFDQILEICQKLNITTKYLNLYAGDTDEIEIEFLDAIESFGNNFDAAVNQIGRWFNSGYKVIFSALGAGTLKRFAELLTNTDLPFQFGQSEVKARVISLQQASIARGFISEKYKIVLITEKDISGQRSLDKDLARMPSRRKKAIDPLSLVAGDYVVHEQHGVGRYLELIYRTINGVSREYLVLEYASSKRGQPTDKLFVPTDTLEQVTKYVGGETPSLHRIGGADWQTSKRKARKAVKQIAAELIKLYAARMSSPGFAFSPDTPWQKELEASFPFVETIDQQSTIDEVKQDMEQAHPMDRIVCGDVGYGKTEIAVRAAFKAVQDGKQVAILVPTTLLVQQHLNTFSTRYSGFPIKIAALSRFNSASESKSIVSGLATGEIDVVIGTHRLLSKDIVFRDLGLLIVDEEQRFGVEHKEELKKARTNVDVLAMSATPIPRTLEMAITGIREMSNITTPPEERHPVLTYVGAYDEKQVTAAIHRELLRDGQIFYIHNRVESIEAVAERLKKLVPELRIGIAHGQMNERVLEEVILSFWNREFDLLLCTTIIESGIDIPNANTLIVDGADVFGLSQLHQLRGRVGRSRERAYAYFLYPTDKSITELAHDRLTTIATNTDLGAGMQVALKDLEIRGAGNLLGGEQSGHIAEVGFDLYMRMVADAVDEFKSGYFEEASKKLDCKVELPINAHIPVEYVEAERLRLDLYRRIADAGNDEILDEIKSELIDRFGELPTAVSELIAVASLRIFARSLGVTEIAVSGKNIRIAPVDLPESAQIKLNRLYPGSIYKNATQTVLVARPQSPNWIQAGQVGDTSTLAWVESILKNLIKPLTRD
ncbi:MAG: transcription-repair coupling factor [Actinobacteria bacterium]|nr:transcription-repair coupling factor [Actinomycetota bacterium]